MLDVYERIRNLAVADYPYTLPGRQGLEGHLRHCFLAGLTDWA